MTMNQTNEFETYLKEVVLEKLPSRTKEAMCYSLMNGGKRVRPQLLFAALQHYGMDPKDGFACACAIEMIHTYSLIHDDLPAMDNDDFRRGKPSCHKAYDEACAILAGDGLLTKAFEVVLRTPCSDTNKVKLVEALSSYSGIDGMIYGQELDIQSENDPHATLDTLLKIDEYKTAKLLTLPLVCAAIIANKHEDIEIMKKIGYDLGVQFQIQDDILDVTKTSEELGKSASDQENNKTTAVTILGLNKAKEMVKELQEDLKKCLMSLNGNTDKLEAIFDYLVKRTY